MSGVYAILNGFNYRDESLAVRILKASLSHLDKLTPVYDDVNNLLVLILNEFYF